MNNLTNIFFNKYFNDNIQDDELIITFAESVPQEIYDAATLEIISFIKKKRNRVEYDKFTYSLFLTIEKLWETLNNN